MWKNTPERVNTGYLREEKLRETDDQVNNFSFYASGCTDL